MKRVLAAMCAACLAASVLSATIDTSPEEQAVCEAGGGCVFATKSAIQEQIAAAFKAGLNRGRAACRNEV